MNLLKTELLTPIIADCFAFDFRAQQRKQYIVLLNFARHAQFSVTSVHIYYDILYHITFVMVDAFERVSQTN